MRLKVVRVVTSTEVVRWHMKNSIVYNNYDEIELTIIGDNVSLNKELFPYVNFIDLPIKRKISPFYDLYSLIKLCRLLTALKPDIVHSIMPKSGLLSSISSYLCGVNTRLHTYTGQMWNLSNNRFLTFSYWSDLLISKLNTYLLTDSLSQSDYLFKHGIHFKGQAIPVLSKGSLCGVDIPKIDESEIKQTRGLIREHHNIDEDDFVFLYLARKTRQKGAFDILNAFDAVKRSVNAKLLFVGPDETCGELVNLMDSNPRLFDSVVSVGSVTNYHDYILASDLLCLPSYREGFGTIVIEAAARNVACVGYQIPGLIDSVDNHSTGVLTPVGNVEHYKNVMLNLFNEKSTLKKMSVNAKVRVEQHFSAEVLSSCLVELYINLYNNRRN